MRHCKNFLTKVWYSYLVLMPLMWWTYYDFYCVYSANTQGCDKSPPYILISKFQFETPLVSFLITHTHTHTPYVIIIVMMNEFLTYAIGNGRSRYISFVPNLLALIFFGVMCLIRNSKSKVSHNQVKLHLSRYNSKYNNIHVLVTTYLCSICNLNSWAETSIQLWIIHGSVKLFLWQ